MYLDNIKVIAIKCKNTAEIELLPNLWMCKCPDYKSIVVNKVTYVHGVN